MKGDNISERLVAALKVNFPNHAGEFTPDLRTENIAGWDSVSHVGLMVSLEEEFGVLFEDEDFISFKTIGELATIIIQKL